MADGLRVAADIGGTFTDLAFIARDGLVATRKVPSTPGNYADAVIRGIDELMAHLKLDKGRIAEVLHGCTVATNTIVEHKGAKTALITTQGFLEQSFAPAKKAPVLFLRFRAQQPRAHHRRQRQRHHR